MIKYLIVVVEKIMRQEKTGRLCIATMYQGREFIIEQVVEGVVSFKPFIIKFIIYECENVYTPASRFK